MPNMMPNILFVFSFVVLVVAAWQHTSPTWNRLIAIGLAALVAAIGLVR